MEVPSFNTVLLFVINLYLLVRQVKAQTCVPLTGQTSHCQCRYTFGTTQKTFDFSPLANDDGNPAFPYQVNGDYEYAYNPCFPFTDITDTSDKNCQDVAACQRTTATGKKAYYDIGDPDTDTYSVQGEDIVITYTTPENRKSIVTYQCDKTALKPIYSALGETSASTYTFTIKTCLACLEAVPGCGSSGGGGLTPGGILCIVFTVLVVVYIVGGILVQYFVRGAQGKELIPNYSFWADFPSLVKDGFMFLVGLCRGERGSDYEAIK